MMMTTAADAPPEMTREYRRTIFAKLQDVYLDEARGYQSPWTDQAVAKDLGCPLAWIATVRDENFGPASDNSEIRAMLDRVTKAAIEGRAFLDDVKKLRLETTDVVAKVNDLVRRATEVGKTLEGLQITADRIAQSVRST
jgi:hypothetical protein